MPRLRIATLSQLVQMICGNRPAFSDFPYRSGADLTTFFTGLDLDFEFSGSRLPWTTETLKSINNEGPDDSIGLSDKMKRIIVEMMDPSGFYQHPDTYNDALQKVNSLLQQYNVEVSLDASRRADVVPRTTKLADPVVARPEDADPRPSKLQVPPAQPPVPTSPSLSAISSSPGPSENSITSKNDSSAPRRAQDMRNATDESDVIIICALRGVELRKVMSPLHQWREVAAAATTSNSAPVNTQRLLGAVVRSGPTAQRRRPTAPAVRSE